MLVTFCQQSNDVTGRASRAELHGWRNKTQLAGRDGLIFESSPERAARFASGAPTSWPTDCCMLTSFALSVLTRELYPTLLVRVKSRANRQAACRPEVALLQSIFLSRTRSFRQLGASPTVLSSPSPPPPLLASHVRSVASPASGRFRSEVILLLLLLRSRLPSDTDEAIKGARTQKPHSRPIR